MASYIIIDHFVFEKRGVFRYFLLILRQVGISRRYLGVISKLYFDLLLEFYLCTLCIKY